MKVRNQLKWRTKKCPECGGKNIKSMSTWSEAHCHIQSLIYYSCFCYDCQSDEVKHRIDNPITDCNDCVGTPNCPATYTFRYILQNDPRDDWPHAILVLREAA